MSQPGALPPHGYSPYPMHPQQQPPPHYRPHPSPELRRDAEAAWQARLELGLDFEDHIAAGLAERVEELAQHRTRELAAQAEAERRLVKSENAGGGRQLALGIVSVVMGVPTTAIALGVNDGTIAGLVISWAGIVGVNVAHALSLRRARRTG